jgi:hypothetical protein
MLGKLFQAGHVRCDRIRADALPARVAVLASAQRSSIRSRMRPPRYLARPETAPVAVIRYSLSS